jgi:hypothetical protein
MASDDSPSSDDDSKEHVQSSLDTLVTDNKADSENPDSSEPSYDSPSPPENSTLADQATDTSPSNPDPASPQPDPDTTVQEDGDTTTTKTVGDYANSGLKFVKRHVHGLLYAAVLTLSRVVRGDTDNTSGLSGLFYPEGKVPDDATVLIEANPSRWQAAGPYGLAILFIATACLTPLAVYTGWFEAYLNARSPSFISFSQPQYWWVFSAICLFFALIATIGEVVHRASTWLVVTNSSIIYRTNPVETQRYEVELDDVKTAEDNLEVPGRFVGMGTLRVYTAGTDNAEVVFKHLRNPTERSDIITAQKSKRSGDTNETVSPESDQLNAE